MTEFFGLCAKNYAYLINNSDEIKKKKGVKLCVVETELKCSYYKNCLFDKNVILKSLQRFKSEFHNLYTKEVNKIALSSNDDKRVWTCDKITSYPYGYKGKHVKRSY